MSRQESLLISAVLKTGSMRRAIREGITSDMFLTYKEEWDWLLSQQSVPSRAVFEAEFPDFRWRRIKTTDMASIINGLRSSYVKTKLAQIIEKNAKNITKMEPLKAASILRDEASEIINTGSTGGSTELISSSNRYVREFGRKQRLTAKGEQIGVSTGIPSLDGQTGGLMPSQLYVIIARQGHGKTYWMLNMAARAIMSGHNVLWVSREMPEDMITYRVHTILSSLMRGPDNSFSNLSLILGKPDVSYDDYRKFITHMRKEIRGKFFVPENRRVNIAQLDTHIERHNPDIVFYDYIGIIGANDSNRGWQELGAQINHAKEIAMQNKIPVVVASQVNRAAKDVDEAPMVENISFSDSIGYAADVVFALNLSKVDGYVNNPDRFLEIWIRKGRYGMNDISTTVKFDGDRGFLEEIEGPSELVFAQDTPEESTQVEESKDEYDHPEESKPIRRKRKKKA